MDIQALPEAVRWALLIIMVIFGTAAVIALVLSPFLLATWLGNIEKRDIFFKNVPEGYAIAIMTNGAFSTMKMSFEGKRWRGAEEADPDDPDSQWDVIDGHQFSLIQLIPIIGKMVGGTKYIGIPILQTVYRFPFQWVSFDLPKGDGKNATSATMSTPIRHSEDMWKFLLLEYTYYTKIEAAETSVEKALSAQSQGSVPTTFEKGTPADLEILWKAKTVNPFKAHIRNPNWYRVVNGTLETRIREIVGQLDFRDLFGNKSVIGDELTRKLESFIKEVRKLYGIEISLIQVHSVKEGGLGAEKYAEQNMKVLAATRNAEAVRINADAERYRIDNTIGRIASNPNMVSIYKTEQIRGSGLTTWIDNSVIGGNPNSGNPLQSFPAPTNPSVVITIPTDQPPINQQITTSSTPEKQPSSKQPSKET